MALGVVAEADRRRPDPVPAGKRGLRLVVFGDSDFATNQLLQANSPQRGAARRTPSNWLVERESLLDIPPKKTEQVHLALTRDEIRKVYLLAGALPLLAVGLGVMVFIRRRRR